MKEALESGKTIIVTTLQKFPVIAEQRTGAFGGAASRLVSMETPWRYKLAAAARDEAVEKIRAVLRARQGAEAKDRMAGAPPTPRQVKDPTKGIRMPPRNANPSLGKNRYSVRPE